MECVLDLSAASTAEVISVAGGWICDRAIAGFRVTVCVPKLEHAESLTILGATARATAVDTDAWAGALVVCGNAMPDIASDRQWFVRHRVSVAARAFKARALLAAGLPSSTVEVETFRLGACSNLLVAREFARTPASAVAP